MHPADKVVGNPDPKTQVYQKPYSGKPDSRNQRRDPIGYYEDTRHTENGNGAAMVPKSASKQYMPSWSNGYAKDEPSMEGSKSNYGNSYAQVNANMANLNASDYVSSNEMLDQAMMTTNGYYKEQTVGGY